MELQRLIQKETNTQGEMFFGKNAMEKVAVALFKLIALMQIKAEHFEVGQVLPRNKAVFHTF